MVALSSLHCNKDLQDVKSLNPLTHIFKNRTLCPSAGKDALHMSSGGATGGLGGGHVPVTKSRQKLSKKTDIKFAGYTFRLKNYVRIPPTSFEFFRAGAATAYEKKKSG